MYNNQYLITNRQLRNSHELKKYSFNHLHVYAHTSLIVTHAKHRSEVIVLGYIINPLKPGQTNQDIVEDLAQKCGTKESLFRELQTLSGRYVLLYKNDSAFIALNDACALRQLYYCFTPQDAILTSSPKMALDLSGSGICISKKDVLELPEYKVNEHWLIGDKCLDDRFRKVLPNHFLDLAGEKILRTPLFFGGLLNERSTLDYASTLLEGSMDAITRRYKVLQPLTAGWDSRTLLAAAKNYKDKIQFYVFDYSGNGTLHPDVAVPQKLSRKLGLNFNVIQPQELKKEFLREYQNEHLRPRIQSNTAEIQYHYLHSQDGNIVRVSGVGEEIVRCFYGYTYSSISVKMLDHFSGYSEKSHFITREITSWFEDSENYAREYGIPVLDLFYWEQRVANLAALFLFEQDMAIEDFSPMCNKSLLLNILRLHPKKRSSPNYAFIQSLIKNLWADCLGEPINPAGLVKYLRRTVKRNSLLRYLNLKTKAAGLFS